MIKMRERVVQQTLSRIACHLRSLNSMNSNRPATADHPVYTYLCAPHGYVHLKHTLGVYLNGFGCHFAQKGECTMCNYRADASVIQASRYDVEKQLQSVYRDYRTQEHIKLEIYTGGSFFDDEEVKEEIRELIFQKVSQWPFVKTIWCESRPEFVTSLKVERLAKICNKYRKHFVVSLGLETTNETIRHICINKSATMEYYISAFNSILNYADLCVTCLFKPIFLFESEAVEDMLNTINFCRNIGCKEFQINCSNIHPNTVMELMWRHGLYRLPWLWSIVEVLRNTSSTNQFKISVTGLPRDGAQVRLFQNYKKFAVNCANCTSRIYKALNLQKRTLDSSELLAIKCPCYEEWKRSIEWEEKKSETLSTRISKSVSYLVEIMSQSQ